MDGPESAGRASLELLGPRCSSAAEQQRLQPQDRASRMHRKQGWHALAAALVGGLDAGGP